MLWLKIYTNFILNAGYFQKGNAEDRADDLDSYRLTLIASLMVNTQILFYYSILCANWEKRGPDVIYESISNGVSTGPVVL